MVDYLLKCGFPTALVVLFIVLVRWARGRRGHGKMEETLGDYFTAVGAFYAVLLAFVLTTVWDRYGEISLMAEREANYLMSVFRLAQGMSEPDATKIKSAALGYARDVVANEWAAMAGRKIEFGMVDTANNLWQTIQRAQPQTRHDEVLYTELLARHVAMAECRRLRLFHSNEGLPPLLWATLLIGATITVSLSAAMAARSLFTHSCLVLSVALSVVTILVAILELSQPFSGAAKLEPTGFRETVAQMERLLAEEHGKAP